MLTPFQIAEIEACPLADLPEWCRSAIRLAYTNRTEFDRQWSGRLWQECCNRGLPEIYSAAVTAVDAENRTYRAANAVAELKGR